MCVKNNYYNLKSKNRLFIIIIISSRDSPRSLQFQRHFDCNAPAGGHLIHNAGTKVSTDYFDSSGSVMSQVRVAWETLTAYLSQGDSASSTHTQAMSEKRFQSLFLDLKHANLDALFISWYLDHIRQTFTNLAPKFWGNFPINVHDTTQSEVFQAVALAHSTYLQTKSGSETLVQTLASTAKDSNENSFISAHAFLDRFRALATSAVFNAAPPNFQNYMFMYFKKTFYDFRKQKKMCDRINNQDNMRDSSDEDGEESEEEEEEDLEIIEGRIEAFRMCVSRLRELGWLGRFEEAFTEMLYVELDEYIMTLCRDEFEETFLDNLVRWADENVCCWLQSLFAGNSDEPNSTAMLSPGEPSVQAWKSRLKFHLYERFCELRTSELFDIIKLFPDSRPALLDFRTALERTHQQKKIIRSLQGVLQRRLLHPGANTSQIIDIYVATIKTLKILDPTGILLESISEPIKDYLRGRHDTVRCIVGSLTDDTSSDLFEELGRGEAKPIEHDDSDADDDYDADTGGGENGHDSGNDVHRKGNPQEWMPDPIDADPTKTSRSRRSNDILSMLVQIYGSKELFVTEYRFILADKLLKRDDFDTDKEVRTLEMLKLRFGESSMHSCEVMVKDIADSKRVNTTIRDMKKKKGVVSPDASSVLGATIVSRHYWPPFKGGGVEFHGKLRDYYETFSNDYGALKAPRSVE